MSKLKSDHIVHEPASGYAVWTVCERPDTSERVIVLKNDTEWSDEPVNCIRCLSMRRRTT